MNKDKVYYLKQEIKSKEQQMEFARKTIWILLEEIKALQAELENVSE